MSVKLQHLTSNVHATYLVEFNVGMIVEEGGLPQVHDSYVLLSARQESLDDVRAQVATAAHYSVVFARLGRLRQKKKR